MPVRQPGIFAICVALTFMAACSSGTDFKRPTAASLELGKTTEQEIQARYGEPRKRGTVQVDDKTIKTMVYTYAEAAPYVEKVPVRVMVYSLHQSALVGFDYSSSFSSDKTDFDESLVNKIVRGQTTQSQVVELLGQPTGMFIYPSALVKTPGHRAYTYSYTRTNKGPFGGNLSTTSKAVTITFDEQNVVTETKVAVTGADK